MDKSISTEQARKAFASFVENRSKKLITFEGTVQAVNESDGVCDVLPNDGNDVFYDVRIVASTDNVVDGIVAIPKVGSVVLCGRFENENNVFLQKTSELSKLIIKCSDGGLIELNGDGHSMLKAESTQEQLNKLQAKVDLIINAISNGVIVAGDGGASYQATMKTILEAAVDADFSNIINDKVKHG